MQVIDCAKLGARWSMTGPLFVIEGLLKHPFNGSVVFGKILVKDYQKGNARFQLIIRI